MPRRPISLLRSVLLATSVALTVLITGPGRADDQDKARAALEKGEIRPLDEVLKAARAAAPGDVVKLDLKRDGGHWFYKLKVLTPEGRRRELKIDAVSLKVLDDDDDDD